MSRPPVNPAEEPDPGPQAKGVPALSESRDNDSGLNPQRVQRPFGVYVISTVVGLEAIALAAAGVVFTIAAFTQPSLSLAGTIFLIVLVFAIAAGLAAVSLNAYKGFRWTRSAAFVWQLLMVAIAFPALLNGATAVGLVLMVPALAVVFYLFTPKVVEFSLRSGGTQPVL